MPDLLFAEPAVVTIHYRDADVAGLGESTLILYYWDGTAWQDASTTCSPPSAYERHPDANWLSVPICRLSRFALFGEALAAAPSSHTVYVPMAVLGH